MATLKKKDNARAVSGALALAQLVGRFPATKLWLDYDQEADVLYVSLKRPQKSTETVDLEDEGVLLHYREDELVGITVLDASQQKIGSLPRRGRVIPLTSATATAGASRRTGTSSATPRRRA